MKIFGEKIRYLSNIPPSLSESMSVRSNVKDFPEPDGPMCNEFAGRLLNGAFGCLTLPSPLVFKAFTSGISFYLSCISQHPFTSMLSSEWSSGISTSLVSKSISQHSRIHLLWQCRELQTYFAQLSQENAFTIEAACPIYFIIQIVPPYYREFRLQRPFVQSNELSKEGGMLVFRIQQF